MGAGAAPGAGGHGAIPSRRGGDVPGPRRLRNTGRHRGAGILSGRIPRPRSRVVGSVPRDAARSEVRRRAHRARILAAMACADPGASRCRSGHRPACAAARPHPSLPRKRGRVREGDASGGREMSHPAATWKAGGEHVTDAKMPSATPATQENLLLRLAVEHFLFEEAAHLDNWRLDEWLALFTEDGRYVVPTTDLPSGDPKRDVMFIDDDPARLRGRVTRLKSRFAHREYPWSRTRRLITNVRLTRIAAQEIDVEASFAVYRARAEAIAPYIGIYRYTLSRQTDDTF